jgi:glycosyltransferase involved in cell wall biosynthesis
MASPMSNKIKLFEWLPSQQDIAKYLNMADCAILPSRAEGFNLNILEAFSCAIPVITTRFSAHQEYVTDQNSYLIDIYETELAFDNIYFDGKSNGHWAKIGEAQKEQCVHYMREIHKRRRAGEDLTNYEGIKTAEKFSWKNTCEKLLKVIS